MSVVPFPIGRCRHFIDMARCHLAAQPENKRDAYLRQLIERHRNFLTNAGVEPGLVARELRDLEMAMSPPPSPNGGVRLAA
jgi:hypothetical protein